MKLYVESVQDTRGAVCKAAARIAGVHVQVVIADKATTSGKEWKEWNKQNITQQLPILETPQGMIAETVAILKYLARQNPDSGLLGQSRLQRAQVEQWLSYANCHIGANVEVIESTLFGYIETFQDEFNTATSDIKSQIKTLDTRLNGQDWLVGERLTLADLYVAALLTVPYSLTLDAGYQKAMGNVTSWY